MIVGIVFVFFGLVGLSILLMIAGMMLNIDILINIGAGLALCVIAIAAIGLISVGLHKIIAR